MPLLFALAVGKGFINTPTPFFKVSSTNTLAELDSAVKAIATEIQQRENQQRDIIEAARQRGRLLLSCFRSDKRPEEPEEEGIEWWELKQEPEKYQSDMSRVCFGDDILLNPDTRYCFLPATGVEAKAHSWAAPDEGAGSEDSSTSDEDSSTSDGDSSTSDGDSSTSDGDSSTSDEESDNRSGEAVADSDVQYVATTLNPFRASNETSRYCAALALEEIKQEPVSDSEIPTPETHKQTRLPVDQRPRKPKVHQCNHKGCNYRTNHTGHLNVHKQTHLPAGLKAHHCDHEGCNFSSAQRGHLRAHKQTHQPADQRPRAHQCDYEGCNFSATLASNLKMHKKIHLPAKFREYHCDHEGCNFSAVQAVNLKAHKKTHLPKKLKGPRLQQCDHEGCNYYTYRRDNLKRHQQTHLPAAQRLKRPKRKAYDQPSSNKKRKKDNQE